jgi:hypothetical protein
MRHDRGVWHSSAKAGNKAASRVGPPKLKGRQSGQKHRKDAVPEMW